jgi:hypothetical protein
LVIAAGVLWLGIKAVRDEKPSRALGYGQRLGAGVLISLYAGLMSALYTYFHYQFINVNFADYSIARIREKWAAAGLGGSQMDQAEKITRTMLSPAVQALMTPVIMVLIGLVLSSIIAAFLESRSPEAPDGAPPAS